MKFFAKRRRNPLIFGALIVIALTTCGAAYAVAGKMTSESVPAALGINNQTAVEEGKRLFLEGCSSCHGLDAQGTTEGPTLIGVGSAAVHFQVATGRMPLAAPGVQAKPKPAIYSEDEILKMAAYVASLAPGPEIPTAENLDFSDADIAEGGILFRTNCSQCHQSAGQGGALTNGKWAPSLMESSPQIIYEAMLSGPQNMPVFGDGVINEENKKAIIAYIDALQKDPSYGGLDLGRLGPVTEGLFVFAAVMMAFIGVAIWIGVKAR